MAKKKDAAAEDPIELTPDKELEKAIEHSEDVNAPEGDGERAEEAPASEPAPPSQPVPYSQKSITPQPASLPTR